MPSLNAAMDGANEVSAADPNQFGPLATENERTRKAEQMFEKLKKVYDPKNPAKTRKMRLDLVIQCKGINIDEEHLEEIQNLGYSASGQVFKELILEQ